MSGFTSLATAVSGLRAAQIGLSVTGHNMANAEIPGYSRQRVTQKEFFYQNIGQSAYGTLKRGLGTDTNAVQQIRNQYLDLTYRTQNGKLQFYSVKSVVGAEIEGLLGEMQGAYKFQDVINDMWNSIQELCSHPQGVETRDYFLATCSSFVNKANEVYDSLFEYQRNLDQQVRQAVTDINSLVSRVNDLNKMIRANEACGDNANDYRDERNNCLDKLSSIIDIDTYEDSYGLVSIFTDGHQLLSQGSQNYMGLKYTSGSYSLVEPVFTSSKTILPANTPPSDFEPYMNYDKSFNSLRDNDYGTLKGLLVARGTTPAYYSGKDALWVPLKPDQPPRQPQLTDTDTNTGLLLYTDPNDPKYKADMLAYQNEYNNFIKLYPGYANSGGTYTPTATDWRNYEAAAYNYKANVWSIENCMIPKTMIALDSIVHSIVTLINDMVAPAKDGTQDPDAPYDLYGNQSYVEIFKRKYSDRWDVDTLIPEQQGNYYSQYSIGNIMLNPDLLDTEGGYNFMAFSLSNDLEDNTLLLDLLSQWSSNESAYAITVDGVPYGIQDAYRKFVESISTEVEEANNFVSSQTLQVTQADNQRYTIMGVSLDEEMDNMMKYQYAYNSAARVLNVIDSMLDKIINGMLR